jgi:hypothetical protein
VIENKVTSFDGYLHVELTLWVLLFMGRGQCVFSLKISPCVLLFCTQNVQILLCKVLVHGGPLK